MKPIRLYIEDFICYEKSFIDFTQFSSALIVGKKDNSDLHSNGVGKTTIFKAIEYVLFNQSDSNLERIIRDGTNVCKIVFDFLIDDREYRLTRSRTRKGASDLSLFQRNGKTGPDNLVYHIFNDVSGEYEPVISKKYWKDISGSRAGDTEKDLAKLIRINYKAFRSTVHFIQNDFNGLTTATPEKRKGILKDALNLIIYSKLEKIAKDQSSILSKEVDKHKILIENLGNPVEDLKALQIQFDIIISILNEKNKELEVINDELNDYNNRINSLNHEHANLETKFSGLLSKEQVALNDKNKLEISIKEYTSKKSNLIKSAKDLMEEVKELKNLQIKLATVDYSQIDILLEQISIKKEKITHNNIIIKNDLAKYEELKIPMPNDSICKHCRQPMTEKHRNDCKKQIIQDMESLLLEIKNSKKEITVLNAECLEHQLAINTINLSKQQLEGVNTSITVKNKEIQDKKELHDEYSILLNKFNNELSDKISELELIKEELKNSSIEEAKNIKIKINEEKKSVNIVSSNLALLNKEIAHHNNGRAVIQHNIDQKSLDNLKIEKLQKKLIELENELIIFPTVIQAFSSTGIPNLIIQNVLDDLQIEANQLLQQLKPGLQLSFFIEKTKGDGTEADTLDINYHINGKERYYEQLSGGMKLAVTFSLKLGLSFLLQKIIGTDVKLLLLDEIDQSLDKASVDAFSDIVKFFQNNFKILVITHNDRLKDKFSQAILVDQDINMVSRAKIVSSW